MKRTNLIFRIFKAQTIYKLSKFTVTYVQSTISGFHFYLIELHQFVEN